MVQNKRFRPFSSEAPLSKLYRLRMDRGRDLKVIITARNSETGTGKTTLAVWLCLSWDSDWDPKLKAVNNIVDYVKTYNKLSPGSCLLFDEAEQVDRRRSMSHLNVNFSYVWMTMRVRQIASILTLPTVSVLDQRAKELADVRIHVLKRGLAKVYKISVDDFRGKVWEEEWHYIQFPNLDWHPAMQYLHKMKDDMIKELEKKMIERLGEKPAILPDRTKSEEIAWKINDMLIKGEANSILGAAKILAKKYKINPQTAFRYYYKYVKGV